MKTESKNKKYVEWLSADELHEDSKSWLSKLKFAKDEHKFLNNLVKEYTLDLLDSKAFSDIRPVIESLGGNEKALTKLLKKVQLHKNQLQIMVDAVNQLTMERAYLKTHTDLTDEVDNYFEEYRSVKTEIFNIISAVIKKRRQKRLLN